MIDFKLIRDLTKEYRKIKNIVPGSKIYKHFKEKFPDQKISAYVTFMNITLDNDSFLFVERYNHRIRYNYRGFNSVFLEKLILEENLELSADITKWTDEECSMATLAFGNRND